MILIGINGFKGSGKNTAAKFIAQWASNRDLVTVERAFADFMVLSMMRSYGLATNMNDARVIYDSFKVNGGILVEVPDQMISVEISGRQAAKWFGTEAHRDVFGEDFWVDQILPFKDWQTTFWISEKGDLADFAVVTDVRFANEARRIRDLGGVVWNIDRGIQGDGHGSEQPLPKELVDLTIPNRSTLEALEVEINSEMTANYHMKFVKPPLEM
jgi:hypothetical protein